MMTATDKEALARRAVAAWQKCGGWAEGILTEDGWRVYETWSPWSRTGIGPTTEVDIVCVETGEVRQRVAVENLGPPDIDDDATLGCIEHGMLPAAWGPDVSITHIDGPGINRTFVVGPNGRPLFTVDGPKGERFVACLEAAAERRKP